MKTIIREITKEQHDAWKDLTSLEAENEYFKAYPDDGFLCCSYGVYDFWLDSEKNIAYLEIGDSCD